MKIFIKVLVALLWIYFILSNIALYDIVMNTKIEFPYWSDMILFPGYLFGFMLGFGGGALWAFIGQFVVFIFLLLISIWVFKSLKTKDIKD
jgi:hypothetical protein